jgi:hypothetical protein
MKLSLSQSESAQDSLRWSVALAMVVFAHGAAGWLLLRSQGAPNSGPDARAIMVDLVKIPEFPIAPRDLGPTPGGDMANDSRARGVGDPGAAKAQEIGSEPPANLTDKAEEAAAPDPVGGTRATGTDMADNGPTDPAMRDSQLTAKAEMPGDTGGGAGPAPAVRSGAILEIGGLQSTTGAPIDANSAVILGRVLNGHKGPNQFKELFAQRRLNEPKGFKELHELEERLFRRPGLA